MSRPDMTVPPEESEVYVPGAMMLDPSCIGPITEILSGADYHDKGLGRVHDAIVRLWSEGKPVEPALVAAEASPHLSDTVAECYQSVGTAVSAPHHAQIIKDAAIRRGIICEASSIASSARQDKRQAADVLGDAQARMLALSGRADHSSLEDTLAEVMEDAEAAREGGSSVVGVPTGFRKIDLLTGGGQAGDMIVLAARPSVGKTSFLVNILLHLLEHTDYGVVMFSAEMKKKAIARRAVSIVSGVNIMKFRTGQMSEFDQAAAEDAVRKIRGWSDGRLVVDDRPAPPFGYMTSAAMRARNQGRCDVVLIDQFSKIGGAGRYESEQANLAERSVGVKNLAMKLDVPVYLAAQIRRDNERGGVMTPPSLEMLKGTGGLEEDADCAVLLHRKTRGDVVGHAEIAKQRDGAAGERVPMRYSLETASWKEM